MPAATARHRRRVGEPAAAAAAGPAAAAAAVRPAAAAATGPVALERAPLDTLVQQVEQVIAAQQLGQALPWQVLSCADALHRQRQRERQQQEETHAERSARLGLLAQLDAGQQAYAAALVLLPWERLVRLRLAGQPQPQQQQPGSLEAVGHLLGLLLPDDMLMCASELHLHQQWEWHQGVPLHQQQEAHQALAGRLAHLGPQQRLQAHELARLPSEQLARILRLQNQLQMERSQLQQHGGRCCMPGLRCVHVLARQT